MNKMMMAGALAAVVSASGCATMYTQEDIEAQARLESEVKSAATKIHRLEERVSNLESANEGEFRNAGAQTQTVEQLLRQQQAMADRIAALEAARVRDREEIANSVSRRVSDVIQRSSSTVSSPQKTVQGYEHVVKAGETLSAIAAAYKVKPSVILSANGIKNANNIRVGQKIFIPE